MRSRRERVVNAAVAGPGWRMLGMTSVVLTVLLLVLFRETTLHVLATWNRWAEYYSHGYAAVAIALYLVYLQGEPLRRLTSCASPLALPAVAVSCLLWLTGALAGVLLLQTLALPLLVLSVCWSMLGGQAARRLVFPVTVVLFALPVWEPLLKLLQRVTVLATFGIVRLLGVPAFRQEQVITLPAGQFSVDSECSGLAYLLAALTLGMLYAALYHRTVRARMLVVAVAAATAVVANVLRVTIVVYQGFVTNMQTSLVTDHFYLGWYLFGGLALILLLLDHKSYGNADASADPGSAVPAAGGEPYTCGYLRYGLVLGAVLVLLLATPALDRHMQQQAAVPQASVPDFPAGAGGWSGPVETQDEWNPVYHGAVEGKRMYRKDGQALYLYIGYYPMQQQGSELIFYLNRISDETVWKMVHPPERLQLAGGREIAEQLLQTDDGRQRLVWYWYHVAGRNTAQTFVAKALQVLGMLQSKPQSGVVAVAADYRDDAGVARHALAGFLSVMEPGLSTIIDNQWTTAPRNGSK